MHSFIRKPNTTCIMCNTPIYKRPCEMEKNKGNVFCSVACFDKKRSKGIPCIVCSKLVLRKFHKKTCSRACSNINRTGTKYKMNRPKDKVVYMDGLKMRLLIERGDTCQRCSFSNTELLIIHHVDRDRTHNDLTNLELICPNCHAAEHYLGKSWIKRYNVEQYRNKLLL